jgi:hypothetical protein
MQPLKKHSKIPGDSLVTVLHVYIYVIEIIVGDWWRCRDMKPCVNYADVRAGCAQPSAFLDLTYSVNCFSSQEPATPRLL